MGAAPAMSVAAALSYDHHLVPDPIGNRLRFLRFAFVAAVVLIGVAVVMLVRAETATDTRPDRTAVIAPTVLSPALEDEDPAEPEVGMYRGSSSVLRGGAGPYSNSWGAFEDGMASKTYAGWVDGDPSRGLITTIKWRFLQPVDVTKAKEWPAPDGVGAITITKVTGNLLQFKSKSGRTGTFDLITHRYLID